MVQTVAQLQHYLGVPAHLDGVVAAISLRAFATPTNQWADDHVSQCIGDGLNDYLASEHLTPLAITDAHIAVVSTAAQGYEILAVMTMSTNAQLARIGRLLSNDMNNACQDTTDAKKLRTDGNNPRKAQARQTVRAWWLLKTKDTLTDIRCDQIYEMYFQRMRLSLFTGNLNTVNG